MEECAGACPSDGETLDRLLVFPVRCGHTKSRFRSRLDFREKGLIIVVAIAGLLRSGETAFFNGQNDKGSGTRRHDHRKEEKQSSHERGHSLSSSALN